MKDKVPIIKYSPFDSFLSVSNPDSYYRNKFMTNVHQSNLSWVFKVFKDYVYITDIILCVNHETLI